MSDASSQSQGVPSPVDFVALSAGRMIGRYEVVSVLGQGGFGITYRARDSQLGREVAIKEYLPLALAVRQDGTTVLPRSTGAADDFTWGRERFVAEGRTLASLQDAPAIVRVFDFLEANGTAYIVMQLLHGETLEGRLKRSGPLKPAEIDRILWPLLDGLEQVHNAGFLHRDIKPANILLDDAGNPTLIDFGASRAAMAGRSTALTAIFTPGYAAAEQMTSAKQGPWTDIYGLSATLYHAITGHTPPSAFDRMLDDGYQPLGKMALPGFARGLLAGLDAGLEVRATDRPQTIAGWRPILGQAAAPDAEATMALTRPSSAASPVAVPPGGADGEEARHRLVDRCGRRAACDAGRRHLRAGRRQGRDAADGRASWSLCRREGGTGCPDGGRGAAPEGSGGTREAPHRGSRPREGRAGGRAAPPDRGGDAAQGRDRDGRQAAPAGRSPPEGGQRGRGRAQDRGRREKGGRNGRERPAAHHTRSPARAGRAGGAGLRQRRHRRHLRARARAR